MPSAVEAGALTDGKSLRLSPLKAEQHRSGPRQRLLLTATQPLRAASDRMASAEQPDNTEALELLS